ncbi:MAG: spoVD 2 [Firmicutes bacterium]|nr:spoVD 2 [Bacillota bacterium]
MAMKIPRGRKPIALLLVMLLGALVVLTARVAWIQFVNGSKLSEKVRNQLQESQVLLSSRGTICDRNGRGLAISNLTKSLYVNPGILNKDPDTLANELSAILGMQASEIKERLMVPGGFVWIKRTLEPEIYDKVKNLIDEEGIKGLDFIEESKRYYPSDRLASQVIGFVGTDDVGLAGVEMTLDKQIKSAEVRQPIDTDSYGIPIFKSILTFNPFKQGKNVNLTIDSTIQFIVEQRLDKVMNDTKARAATIIMMNPHTGEILAMASRPTYDPNYFYRANSAAWNNRAISVVYEPGSTFKTIVAAAALEEKKVRPDELLVDKGYIEVSGRRIQNWNGQSYGTVSFLKILEESINTGFVQVGMRLGAVCLNQYVRAFGFGQPTGIELPGEESGLLFETKNMRDSDLATMSIGQSIAVTPLQLLTAVSAIANDGVLLKPHIIKEIYNADGSLVLSMPPEQIRQVISPETARVLAEMMEKEVSEGGGQKAAVTGYHFAGKTGTAERLNESGSGYAPGEYIASFIGFGPVEDPQVAMLVVIDSPEGVYYGAQIAAPVFHDIMTEVMRYLGVRPLRGTQPVLNLPAAMPGSTTIKLGQPAPNGKASVPDVTGLTIRQAGIAISNAGLAIIPQGTGVAVSQSIAANAIVDPGTEIIVNFEPR